MMKTSIRSQLIWGLALSLLTATALAQAPANQVYLGAATYITMPLRQLSNPVLLYADDELLAKNGLTRKQALETFGYASPVEGEAADAYSNKTKTAYIDGNGGIGLNDNFGSGRAAIIDGKWQIKGSGKTAMVNPATDDGHRNGASVLAEGIHEAVWSNLLAAELPGSAFRVVAVIGTGSRVNSGGHDDQPRVLIVREDPLRPGHYVINPTAESMNDPRDKARVEEAMKRLVDALPQPEGPVPQDRVQKFRRGLFEFIDRQAKQHSYAWAHSLFHGGTSPTNTGFDGRALDFGTYSAFDGYPKARILHDDGFMGETEVYKRDLLKDIRDSWVKTLPADLLAALPAEKEWFDRFDASFDKTRRTEMLRLAGAFTELADQLLERRSGQDFSKLLLEIAMAGNEKPIEIWKGENPFGQGKYNLGKILLAASQVDLSLLTAEASFLRALIPEDSLRRSFVKLYGDFVQDHRALAQRHGILIFAEAEYRRLASEIRNKKMNSIFRITENERHIWKILEDYKKTGDSRATQEFIDRKISMNRRDFHDAKPFTIVLRESKRNGQSERVVFDAKVNRVKQERIPWTRRQMSVGRCERVLM